MTTAQRKPVIGLVGGIGSGKSLVADQLRRLGCGIVDADQLGRDAIAAPDVRAQIEAWWPQVRADGGGIDRAALARVVFGDKAELRRLEDLVHPCVRAARQVLHESFGRDPDVRAIVEDCPLLMEVGLDSECDVIIFVHASRPIRLARLKAKRGWSEEDLARREKNQLPLDKKAGRADYKVDNDASEAECLAHVRGVFFQILACMD
ncbi:MAG: dephospho-CoA kinase [Phycisphaeraceae bacterium]|nr:dephospho-CoA kinase [Phycisphaeraceae bacterium]